MSNNDFQTPSRRNIFTAAGVAAAGLVAGSALHPPAANAADGEPVKLGKENTSTSTTTFSVRGKKSSHTPAVRLDNGSGPSLNLTAVDEVPDIDFTPGDIVNTLAGPWLGIRRYDTDYPTYLATGEDLRSLAFGLPLTAPLDPPRRVLDARSSHGRIGVIRASPHAFNGKGQLSRNSWVDVDLGFTLDDVHIHGAYVTLTALATADPGYMTVIPPDTAPRTATLYAGGQTVCSSTFIAARGVEGRWSVRVYSYAVTKLVLDLTGVVASLPFRADDDAERKIRVLPINDLRREEHVAADVQKSIDTSYQRLHQRLS